MSPLARLAWILPLAACIGAAQKSGNPRDEDGDGFLVPYDCDDTDPDRNPDASERCNGVDDDCDFEIDEDPIDGYLWYRDQDEDGYGQSAYPHDACFPDEGEVGTPGDCDDTDPDISPAATEACDGLDNDCDGTIDENTAWNAIAWYPDLDDDGWGDEAMYWVACWPPFGYRPNAGDCDDSDADVYPWAPELCDGLDNDCDGAVDEGATANVREYRDADGDGYGSSSTTWVCEGASGYSLVSGDCDDGDADQHPGAEEICNDADDDCDGGVDNDATGMTTWYKDDDGDGHGQEDGVYDRLACSAPDHYVGDADDCDDAAPQVYPGAVERCGTEVDSDCDGALDPCDIVRLMLGSDASQGLGAALAETGDLDGDGLPDLALGAPLAEDSSGDVYVWTSDGPDLLWSGRGGDGAGAALAGGEDLDGDGRWDLLVGAPNAAWDTLGAGAVYVLLDPGAGGSLLGGDLILQGDASEQHLGAAIALLGSDASGYGRALVGAPGDDRAGTGAGAALLFVGGKAGEITASEADLVLIGAAAGDGAGGALASCDADADGIIDFVVASPGAGSGAGSVSVVLAPVSGELSLEDADITLEGGAATDGAGSALLAPGDLDGDGREDLLVGAPGAEGDAAHAGLVYLLGGPLSSGGLGDLARASWVGATEGGAAGSAMAVTDLDGDGTEDLAIGAPNDDSEGVAAGTVWLIRGPLSGTMSLDDADARVPAGAAGDATGAALLAPGDLDGVGGEDLLAGAPGDDKGGEDAGAVILLTWPG